MPSKALKASQIAAGGTDARALHGGFTRATVRLQMPGRATVTAARAVKIACRFTASNGQE